MNIKRRDFIKGCTTASVLLLPGIAVAAKVANANNAPTSDAAAQIEKSIKAAFGGGFSLQTHSQSNGLTYAEIENFGNRYKAASTDLLDWKVVGSL